MAKSKKIKLNIKQELFADWYIKLGNAFQAAVKAGYSEKSAYVTGSRMLRNANIQAYIRKRKEELEELLGFNKATVIQDLLQIKDKSMQAQPVMYYSPKDREYKQKTDINEKGEEVGVYEYDSQGAIKALENIAKMMDYYSPEKTEDVTPLENKTPAIIVNKTYVSQESNQPPAKAD